MASRKAQILEMGQQFDCFGLAFDHLQRGTSASEFKAIALERMRHSMQGFSFRNAIGCQVHDPQKIDGYEGELLREWAGPAGFDHRRWNIPWSALIQRDLHVATPGTGGYVTDSQNLEARDILRPWSVTARAGLEIVADVSSNALLPITTAKSTIHWLASETAEATESTPIIGQELGEPKNAIGMIEFSRQFAKQSNFDVWIRRELLKTAGTAIDEAVLDGSGAAGEPEGLLNISGTGTEAGASFTHAKSLSMKRKCADANVDDESISFLAAPATRELLEAREVGTDTGQHVWQGDQVADRKARVTTDIPAATLIAGSWQTALLLLWGNGIEIEFKVLLW